MVKTVVWSQESLDDINNIAEYISRDSLYHAQLVVENIIERGANLKDQPESGRKVPELDNPLVRECFIYSYRLIYEINGRNIHILGVIHGKRLLESTGRFVQQE